MTATAALAALRKLDVPAFTTADARALLRQSASAAHKTLARLADDGLLVRLAHGLWTTDEHLDPMLLAESLTAPMPSYVSLQTALYRRGVIEQIPAVIYVVGLSRAAQVHTKIADFSVHRIPPELYGGFEVLRNAVKLATAEKAIVDFVYLSGGRGRLFAALPEIELPRGFDAAEVRRWLEAIPSRRLRTLATQRYEAWVQPFLPKRRRR